MTRRNNNRRRNRGNGGFISVLKEINKDITLPANATTGGSVDLLTVPIDSQASMTVRNFTTDLIIETQSTATNAGYEKAQYYVMFLPEGHTVTANLPFQHPEWILSYAYQGTPKADTESLGFNIRKRSRKTRKLRPGDSIFLFTLGENNTSSATTINVSGLIKYFSKMN